MSHRVKALLLQGGVQLTTLKTELDRLETLDLEDFAIILSVEKLQILNGALVNNETITTLDLFSNSLGKKIVESNIPWMLANNKQLQSIKLGFNNIGPSEANAIASALIVNKGIIELDLSHNPLEDAGVDYISAALMRNNNIRSINLSHTGLEGDGAVCVAEMIENSESLRYINLSGNNLGLFFMEDDSNGMERKIDAIADALKVNKTLLSIDLSYNRLEPYDIEAISEMLEVNSTLKFLDLSYNDIGDDEAAFIADAIRYNNTLDSIDLSGNELGDDGVQAIVDALEHNYTITSIMGIKSDAITHLIQRNLSAEHELISKFADFLEHYSEPKAPVVVEKKSSLIKLYDNIDFEIIIGHPKVQKAYQHSFGVQTLDHARKHLQSLYHDDYFKSKILPNNPFQWAGICKKGSDHLSQLPDEIASKIAGFVGYSKLHEIKVGIGSETEEAATEIYDPMSDSDFSLSYGSNYSFDEQGTLIGDNSYMSSPSDE